MDLFFLTAANFKLFFLKKKKKKRNFGLKNKKFLGKQIESRRHLPHLLKLTNLFSKNMSKLRANNHFLFVLIFYSQVQANDF